MFQARRMRASLGLVAAGCIGFTVEKQVTNGTSAGPFVLHINCSDDEGTERAVLTFDTIDGSGQQTISSGDFDLSPTGPRTCTFTEEPLPVAGVAVTIERASPGAAIDGARVQICSQHWQRAVERLSQLRVGGRQCLAARGLRFFGAETSYEHKQDEDDRDASVHQ